MGMSDDLEAAIMEGATIVRIGTAIFGRTELHDMKITFIGGGNMAVALIGGLRRQGFSAAASRSSSPSPSRATSSPKASACAARPASMPPP
jgi:hypothetical protein